MGRPSTGTKAKDAPPAKKIREKGSLIKIGNGEMKKSQAKIAPPAR